jgi:hypothetical protein
MALYLPRGETIPEWQSFSLTDRQQVIWLLTQSALQYLRLLRGTARIAEESDASQDHVRSSDPASDHLCPAIDPAAGA